MPVAQKEQSLQTQTALKVAPSVSLDVEALPIAELSVSDKSELLEYVSKFATNVKSKDVATRTAALRELVTKNLAGVESQAVNQILPAVFSAHADKQNDVRAAAKEAAQALISLPGLFSARAVLPVVFTSLTENKWQTKVAALEYMSALSHKIHVASQLNDILPPVSEAIWDTKPEVKAAAISAMTQLCVVCANPDVVPAVPDLVGCVAHPERVSECVHKLAATTFVTTVEAPALAVMTPLLSRGLAERSPAVQRQTAVIIDNMCKLVENPRDTVQFLPKLGPALERIISVAADADVREVAQRAYDTLTRVSKSDNPHLAEDLDAELAQQTISDKLTFSLDSETLKYAVAITQQLVGLQKYDAVAWQALAHLFSPVFAPSAKGLAVAEAVRAHYHDIDQQRERAANPEDEETGEVLCDCEFSLAYGGMILLNNTRFKLRRGQRYGLCGPNGAGKSTLMRAIAEGKLEGFPSADELRTVYVEHNLQAEDAELSVLEFMFVDPKLQKTAREEVIRVLSSVGFTDVMQAMQITSLSGGWKMKLELARAMLMNADILLLDEPTNHLDVTNVAWLENYLTGLKDVTSIVVSHDSGFLDNVCTGIIHYENRKLKSYRGNLSEFVKVKPEARSYYQLTESAFTFKLPEPGFLDGVKSKNKAILKLISAGYTYPGAASRTLAPMSCQCSLNSRIAVVGPNGAGKSTMIKMLTGEIVPDVGEVTKHPNLRVAYVAQHAFHHIEQHLDKTACEYICWRYQSGEDREMLEKAARQMTDEEKAQMAKPVVIEGEKRQIEAILGRRKAKRSFEYELKFIRLPYEKNEWIVREKLEEWGFIKLVQAFDDAEAARAGAWTRPLTTLQVQKHLADLGLDPEFSTHNRMRGLSGGQKVKVVIGASMWLNPHMLVLDEPTNYLDRDSLGALAEAIKAYGGGVVMISHNNEFTGALCTEKWSVNGGILTLSGQDYTQHQDKIDQKEVEETIDRFGNVQKVKSTRKLTRKEIKQREKRRALAKKNGEEVSTSEDEL